jgi:hypothetical protein
LGFGAIARRLAAATHWLPEYWLPEYWLPEYWLPEY